MSIHIYIYICISSSRSIRLLPVIRYVRLFQRNYLVLHVIVSAPSPIQRVLFCVLYLLLFCFCFTITSCSPHLLQVIRPRQPTCRFTTAGTTTSKSLSTETPCPRRGPILLSPPFAGKFGPTRKRNSRLRLIPSSQANTARRFIVISRAGSNGCPSPFAEPDKGPRLSSRTTSLTWGQSL